MTTFDDSFAIVIGVEKGYSNDPEDPGGETMWGITKRVAVAWSYKGEMKDLPLTVAKQIAKSEYWDKFQCDQFDPRIGFQIFDIEYNGGYAAKWLQQAVGAVVDGNIGAKTIAAVRSADPMKVIMRINSSRLHYMADLKNRPRFAGGWMHRVADNLALGAK